MPAFRTCSMALTFSHSNIFLLSVSFLYTMTATKNNDSDPALCGNENVEFLFYTTE